MAEDGGSKRQHESKKKGDQREALSISDCPENVTAAPALTSALSTSTNSSSAVPADVNQANAVMPASSSNLTSGDQSSKPPRKRVRLRGPRRSQSLLVAPVSGQSALAFPVICEVDFLVRDTSTGLFGIKLRQLECQHSLAPIAVLFVGKCSDKPCRNSITDEQWSMLDSLLGWYITKVNGIPLNPPSLRRCLNLLATGPACARIVFSQRRGNVMDTLFRHKYYGLALDPRKVSWEVPLKARSAGQGLWGNAAAHGRMQKATPGKYSVKNDTLGLRADGTGILGKKRSRSGGSSSCGACRGQHRAHTCSKRIYRSKNPGSRLDGTGSVADLGGKASGGLKRKKYKNMSTHEKLIKAKIVEDPDVIRQLSIEAATLLLTGTDVAEATKIVNADGNSPENPEVMSDAERAAEQQPVEGNWEISGKELEESIVESPIEEGNIAEFLAPSQKLQASKVADLEAKARISFQWGAIKVNSLAPPPPCMFRRSLQGLAESINFGAPTEESGSLQNESSILSSLSGRSVHILVSEKDGILPCSRFASSRRSDDNMVAGAFKHEATITNDGKLVPLTSKEGVNGALNLLAWLDLNMPDAYSPISQILHADQRSDALSLVTDSASGHSLGVLYDRVVLARAGPPPLGISLWYAVQIGFTGMMIRTNVPEGSSRLISPLKDFAGLTGKIGRSQEIESRVLPAIQRKVARGLHSASGVVRSSSIGSFQPRLPQIYGKITSDSMVVLCDSRGRLVQNSKNGEGVKVSLEEFVRRGITRDLFKRGTLAKFEPFKWIQILGMALPEERLVSSGYTQETWLQGSWVSFSDLYNAQVRRLMQARAGMPPPSGSKEFADNNSMLLSKVLGGESEEAAVKRLFKSSLPMPNFSEFTRTQQQKLRAEHAKAVEEEKQRFIRERQWAGTPVRRWRDLAWGAKVGMAGLAVGFFERSQNTVVDHANTQQTQSSFEGRKKVKHDSGRLRRTKSDSNTANPESNVVSVPLLVGYITSEGSIRCQGRDMSIMEFALRARGWSKKRIQSNLARVRGWRPWTRIRDLQSFVPLRAIYDYFAVGARWTASKQVMKLLKSPNTNANHSFSAPSTDTSILDPEEHADAYPGWCDSDVIHACDYDAGGCSGRWQGWANSDVLGYSHIAFDDSDESLARQEWLHKDVQWWKGSLGAEEEHEISAGDGNSDSQRNSTSDSDSDVEKTHTTKTSGLTRKRRKIDDESDNSKAISKEDSQSTGTSGKKDSKQLRKGVVALTLPDLMRQPDPVLVPGKDIAAPLLNMMKSHQRGGLLLRLYSALNFEYKDNGGSHFKHRSRVLVWNPSMTGRWYTSNKTLFSDLISRCSMIAGIEIQSDNPVKNTDNPGSTLINNYVECNSLVSAKKLQEFRRERLERRALQQRIEDTKVYYYGASAVPSVAKSLASGVALDYDFVNDYDAKRGIYATPTIASAALLREPSRQGLLGSELNVATKLLQKINKHPLRDNLLALVSQLCFEYRNDVYGQHCHMTLKVSI